MDLRYQYVDDEIDARWNNYWRVWTICFEQAT